MHDILKSFEWKTNPKFEEKLINFEKSQNFQKLQNLSFKIMKCMKKEWKRRSYHLIWSKEGRKSRGMEIGVKKSGLGDEQPRTDRREIEKWEWNRDESLNRHLSKSRQLRCREVSRMLLREVSRKLAFDSWRCRGGIEVRTAELILKLDRSTRCREGIEETEKISIDPPSVENVSRLR